MTAPLRELEPNSRPRVLALMPHYGEAEETEDAAAALVEAGYPDLIVVVVDNSGNLDATRLPPGVELEVPGHNVGYCVAVNIGLRRAVETESPMLLLVNNDTSTPPGVIEGLADALLADDSVAGAGPLLTTDGGETIWSAGSFLRFGPNEVKQRGLGQPVRKAPPYPDAVDFIPGALALYWTEDLRAIGGIDEEYFMYLEDVDLGVRLRRRGRRLLYLPWLRSLHGGSISSGGGVTPLRKFLNGVNTPRLLRRCRSVKLWVSFLLFDVLGLLPSVLLHLHDRRRTGAQIAKGRGIFLGLTGYRPGPDDVKRYCKAEELS